MKARPSCATMGIVFLLTLAGAAFAQETPTPTPTPTATPAPPRVTAGKDGFALQSADGSFVLRLGGYVQADGRFFDGGAAPDTFVMRRVRPIVEGTVFKIFDFRVMPDFGGGNTVLQDGYVEARFLPALRMRAGKFKPPLGLERLQSARDLVFVERAMPTNLVPSRDVGIELGGSVANDRVEYQVGVFNGNVDLGVGDSDNNDAKDIDARIFVHPLPKESIGDLGVGIAASAGDQAGSVLAPNLPAFRTAGQVNFFSYRTDGSAAGTTIAAGERRRIVPQATFYSGHFGLMAEYVQSKQEVRRGEATADVANTAWQTAVSWVFGENASYRGVNPKRPFSGAGTGPGAFEIAARYSELDVDDDAFPTFANPAVAARNARTLGFAFNWWASRNARLMLSYERTKFDGGAPSGDRPDERVLLSRLQISF
jgi:phosphate-selective porin OprO/OprP